jgi:hypothetical protein
MKKIILALTLTIALAGCAGKLPTLNLASSVNLNTLEGVVAGYGIAVNQEKLYKAQPLCRTGTTPSITNICAKRSTIVRLQAADRIANSAVNQAVLFAKNNPTVDPSSYTSAAAQALSAFESVINTANAGG